jgi:predicted PhzF superfamily epimerase YddE/YHI9
MPEYQAFIVDAFTKQRFAGNQAAVCLVDRVGTTG